MYAEECATCEFWESDEQDEYCTFELCIHFPEEEKEPREEHSHDIRREAWLEEEAWLQEIGLGEE